MRNWLSNQWRVGVVLESVLGSGEVAPAVEVDHEGVLNHTIITTIPV